MAKALPGSIFSTVSGRIGGIVSRKNPGGVVLQRFPSMKQHPSELQMKQRIFTGNAAAKWKTLTTNQRRAWAQVAFAGETKFPGAPVNMQSGFAAFSRWFISMQWCNVTPTWYWPVDLVFDNATECLLDASNASPAAKFIGTKSTTIPAGAALWACHSNKDGGMPGRPLWQLVAASSLGDSFTWLWNDARYPSGWSAQVDTFLAARFVFLCSPPALCYRLRIAWASTILQLRNDRLTDYNA
jgi:hypothetical protein